MADINLIGINKETFGKKMPNVFVNKVEIYNLDETGIAEGSSVASGFGTAISVKAYLSIKFTKPQFMQGETIRDYISSTDLQLYTFLTFPDYVKQDLEQDRFSLNYWFTHGASEHDGHRERFDRVPLADLVDEDILLGDSVGTTGKSKAGQFQKLNVFDNDGDEIVEISNIIVELDYYKPAGTSDHIPELTDVEGLMFFAFVGPMFNILHSSD